jgi:uncharacterized protein involved in outer membrane biogenesis
LIEPDILIETDAKGKGNFEFDTAAKPAEDKKAAPAKDAKGGKLPAIEVDELRIEKASFTYKDGVAKKTTQLAIDKLSIRPKSFSGPVALDLAGVFDKIAFSVAGEVGAIEDLTAGTKPYPLKLTAKAGGATVNIDGTIAKIMEGKGLALKIGVDGAELAELAKLGGQQLASIGPYKIGLKVSGDPDKLSLSDIDAMIGKKDLILITAKGAVKDPIKLAGIAVAITAQSDNLGKLSELAKTTVPPLGPLDLSANVADGGEGIVKVTALKAKLGKSDLAGDITANTKGARPSVVARLSSGLLDLDEVAGGGKAPEKKAEKPAAKPADKPAAKPADGKVLPKDPLPLDGLKAADADAEIKVAKLITNGVTVEGTEVKLMLKDGRLNLSPAQAKVSGGLVSANVVLDGSSGKTAGLVAKVTTNQVNFGDLLKTFSVTDLIEGGKMDTDIDISGNGGSVRDLLGGLNGKVKVVINDGKINNTLFELLTADAMTTLANAANPMAKKEPYTKLKCAVVNVPIKAGLVDIQKTIAAETDRVNVIADGKVNLATEGLDLAVRPEPKEGVEVGVGNLAKMVRIGGTFAEPKAQLDAMEALKTAANVGAAVATGGLSVIAGAVAGKASGSSGKDNNPCMTALGQKAPASASAEPKAEPAKPAASPAASAVETLKAAPGGVLNKVFGK